MVIGDYDVQIQDYSWIVGNSGERSSWTTVMTLELQMVWLFGLQTMPLFGLCSETLVGDHDNDARVVFNFAASRHNPIAIMGIITGFSGHNNHNQVEIMSASTTVIIPMASMTVCCGEYLQKLLHVVNLGSTLAGAKNIQRRKSPIQWQIQKTLVWDSDSYSETLVGGHDNDARIVDDFAIRLVDDTSVRVIIGISGQRRSANRFLVRIRGVDYR